MEYIFDDEILENCKARKNIIETGVQFNSSPVGSTEEKFRLEWMRYIYVWKKLWNEQNKTINCTIWGMH